jgi:hypothetical protein
MFFFKVLLVRSALALAFYNFFFSDQFRPHRPLPSPSDVSRITPVFRIPGVCWCMGALQIAPVLLRSSAVLTVFIFYT